MSERQRYPEHLQAVVRAWLATLTADDPDTLADAIEAYIQALIDAGRIITSEQGE
jgi:alkanesulfonate monooxygenase SsuD/methylene tetrahydromethanopterin reductase-like flavin-dependent oxidoreductase (luciferase family)